MKRNAYLPKITAVSGNIIKMTPLCVLMNEPVVFKEPDNVVKGPIKNCTGHILRKSGDRLSAKSENIGHFNF